MTELLTIKSNTYQQIDKQLPILTVVKLQIFSGIQCDAHLAVASIAASS
jgi:hypothetical protein